MQCSGGEREREAAVEEEEESSRPCVEWEVPRELLLHRDQLMPPLEMDLRDLRRIFGKYSRRVGE